MLNVFLLTYFTKKLDLVIIEKNSSITDKYNDYLQSIFKNVKNYNSQEEFLIDPATLIHTWNLKTSKLK